MIEMLMIVQIVLIIVLIGLVVFKRSTGTLESDIKVVHQAIIDSNRVVKDELVQNRDQFSKDAKSGREESQNSLLKFTDTLLKRMTDIATLQKQQLDTFAKQLTVLTDSNNKGLETMRQVIEKSISDLQKDNNKKLEDMRMTVDEKLHKTLEKRLGESFKLVSDRLEVVHKGLGEMQQLASGVGDLKKVLTNVKTRGIWGEIQLGNLLEQLLTSDQYEKDVRIKKNRADFVEYAVKLPGRDDNKDHIWLPIDAKFPLDTYQHLLEAQEQANPELVQQSMKQLEMRIKLEAKTIQEKYVDPPNTTDFGIIFLPIEGLYAEILRIPGLQETLQRDYRILLAGPTTLAALLNSLQMGFRTLAVEKRSSEVWQLLSVVKTEFGKFGDILEKTQKKIQEAGNTMDLASRKSRTIERKLRTVQELPDQNSPEIPLDMGVKEPLNDSLFSTLN
ncbi:DNA recombination protein RmuC [Candidatus Marinamargulisbacteria bacterium SCGC AG-410-N11]|nr:DNA recombination protein RmuC [Candidatus Marinamargulisbacteria bacterium SCGC AG-410-N11]